jgi:hypothetical protein
MRLPGCRAFQPPETQPVRQPEPMADAMRRADMRLALVLAIAMLLAACLGPDGSSAARAGTLRISAVAGPTCPVERQPPDPNCAARPVAGVRVVVTPADGREILVAQGTTDERGMLVLEVAAGAYLVTGSQMDGLMGTAAPVQAEVMAGGTASVILEYDTGIR